MSTSTSAMSYRQTHHALCMAIDELSMEVEDSSANQFARATATDDQQQRALRLDTFLARARSRKGKEPERLGMWTESDRELKH
jgi:hypothetical protein